MGVTVSGMFWVLHVLGRGGYKRENQLHPPKEISFLLINLQLLVASPGSTWGLKFMHFTSQTSHF